MEFDELQKIWHSQTNEPLWVINEQALYKRIQQKKKKVSYIANFSELLLLVVYIGSGSFIIGLNYVKPRPNLLLYVMAAWMLGTAVYVLVSRVRRMKNSYIFDRSLLGELNQAVSTATYQVQLSQIVRWNVLPIGILSLWSVLAGGQSVWFAVGILLVFVLSYYGGRWEHRIYVAKKRELEVLQRKLAIN